MEENKHKSKECRKGFCITSMVLGIVALVFFFVWFISIPCGVLAIIFGVLGSKSVNSGMAITGIVTGCIGTIISMFIMVILLYVLGVLGLMAGVSCTLDEIDNDYDSGYYQDYDL